MTHRIHGNGTYTDMDGCFFMVDGLVNIPVPWMVGIYDDISKYTTEVLCIVFFFDYPSFLVPEALSINGL